MTNLALLKQVLAQVEADLGAPEFVLFNPAPVQPSKALEFSEEELMQELTISTAALHVTARWAIPSLLSLASQPSGAKPKPTLLVTSALLPQEPDPNFVVLSASKAAQYNLTQSSAGVYGHQGVHVGVVVVGGVVAPENKMLSPRNIAAETWNLYNDEKNPQRWSVELSEP